MFFLTFLMTVIIGNASGLHLSLIPDLQNSPTIPKSYFFSYDIKLDENGASNSRTESSDGRGSVEGSYRIKNDEGHYRIVKYMADENGFRAAIETNEPGTGNQNPADVSVDSKVDSPVNSPVLETSTPQTIVSTAATSTTRDWAPRTYRVGTFLPKDQSRGVPVKR